MSRFLARLLGWRARVPARGADEFGEFLRGPGAVDTAPEVLLRIL
jgi:hypothetical protein